MLGTKQTKLLPSQKVINTPPTHQLLAKKLLSELELVNDFQSKFSCDLDF